MHGANAIHIRPLTPEQEEMIRQVEAAMAVEDLPLTEEAQENLYAIASGDQTVQQVIDHIKAKYRQP